MQEFLTNNIDLFWTVGTIVVLFLATFIFMPFAQKKGWLTPAGMEAAHKALEMATLAVSSVNLGNAAAGKTAMILKATEAAVGYVEQTMKLDDNEAKRLNAQKAAIDFLKHEGIEVTDELQKLIDVGLQSAVNKLPKTNS
jgi:hypothetical protein